MDYSYALRSKSLLIENFCFYDNNYSNCTALPLLIVDPGAAG